jgi:predicted nucleic acid-binding protein
MILPNIFVVEQVFVHLQKHSKMKNKKLKIYLDNCCFNRPFDDQKQLKIKLETEAKLFIQQGVLTGKYELVWSYILEFENNQNPYDDRRSAVNEWSEIAVVHCIENDAIINFAEKLHKIGIKTKDALHIACSVYSNADYLITTDKRLYTTKFKEIKIVNPLTFINEEA